MTRFKLNNRLSWAWLINLTLIALTVIISVAGYKAYQRLNNMVSELQQNAEQNYNLLILKDVSFFVNEMETQIDAYRNRPNPDYIRSFNEALDNSQYLIDSLETNYFEREEMLELCDSLSFLIKERAKVQTKLTAINSDLLENTLEDLTQKMEKMPQLLAEADTITPEKNGFFKKAGRFLTNAVKKKENRIKADTSVAPTQSEILQSEIMSELAKAKEESIEKGSELRYQLSTLEKESQVFQNKIIDVINSLESHELEEGRDHVKDIQALASDTNREVVIFSALSSALLLITLISQLNYVGRNRKYQAVLREAKKNAEELGEAKEKFLANMSHEIRTPMNAISGFTNQLLKNAQPGEQKEQLQIIKSSSDHLLHLLNDILDFSKLQANKVKLNQEAFDLKLLMHETARIFEEMADEKGLKLKTEFDNIPQFVVGDEHRLRQIILNLLHNAIKFTDKGYVQLSASVHAKSANQVSLRIAVKDSGVGIPKDKQARIFEEFEQASVTDESKGTGLGLAISAMLVKLQKGEFLIESEIGKGTEMILILPFTIGEGLKEEVKAKDEKLIHLSGISVLVADDEPFNLKLLETIFKSHDIKLVQTQDGTEALAALQAQVFDIAILDVKMPGLSGLEVVKQIRKTQGNNSQIPMVALTATVSEQEMKESLDSGFDRILRKPFDENALLEMIRVETMKTKMKKSPVAEIVTEVPKFDLSGLREMGDDEFVNEMVDIFKSSSARSIENLKMAIELKIRDSLKNEAHKMLPPARHLSATDLVKALEALQIKADKETFDELSIRIAEIETIYNGITAALKA
ncbi:response regulator [Roseivirga sp.]|uniref:response regulator n=1 Tax=Roseivirga sp. TaxID=1964215 RepID=UPI002B273623|nr:response regulator [Roseivirga sp.]